MIAFAVLVLTLLSICAGFSAAAFAAAHHGLEAKGEAYIAHKNKAISYFIVSLIATVCFAFAAGYIGGKF
jgi:ABC-type transporter Mla maintaining outer membrane lipid asymmetry permease subunit MlaE